MGRAIWTKLQSDPNGSWTRHEGDPPFSIPATGGLIYDVYTDAGDSFTITPEGGLTAPSISGTPVVSGIYQVGQTLTATAATSSGTAPITTSWQWLRNGADISGATGASYLLAASDETATVSVRQTDSNSQGNDSAVSTGQVVQAATTGEPADITTLFIADQDAAGEVVLTYTINKNSAVSGVVTRSGTTPTATQITAGQDHAGNPANSVFSDFWTTSGSDTLPDIAAGLTADMYYLHVLPVGGNDGDAVSSTGFTLETVAPVVTSARTSEIGDRVVLELSENAAGASVPGDWSLTVAGSNATIDSITISGNSLALILSDLIASGEALTLSYTGTGITDTVANTLAAFTDLAITNEVSASFTENSVTVQSGAYLTANEMLPSDAKSLLFFASFTQNPAFDGRMSFATWDGPSGGFYTQYSGGNGTSGIRFRIQDGTASITSEAIPVPHGNRYHVLASAWTGAPNMTAIAYILDTATGSWSEVLNITDTSNPQATLNLGPDHLRFMTRSDGTNHSFSGTVNRIALWTGTAATPLADITQASARDMFATAAGMENPTVSRQALGTALVDFHGDAAAYNAGTHSGSLGAFTASGTFT